MRWATLVYVMLFAATAKGDGVDEAFQDLRAKNKLYEASLSNKVRNLTLLDCYAEKVTVKELSYKKGGKAKVMVVSREQLRDGFEERQKALSETSAFLLNITYSLRYDLGLCKWKRESGTMSYVGVPPADERRPNSRITFIKHNNRYVVSAFEAAPAAAGE